MHSHNKNTFVFFYIFCLASAYFFEPVIINLDIFKIIFFLALVFMMIKALQVKFKDFLQYRLSAPVTLLLFAIIFSIVPALLSHQQDVFDSLIVTLPSLSYAFYFYLLKTRYSVKDIERQVIYIALLSTLVTVIATYFYPAVLFGNKNADDIDTERGGFARMELTGSGFIYLGYFITLCEAKRTRNIKLILLCVIFFGGIVLSLTRQSIIGCAALAICVLMTGRFTVAKLLIGFVAITGIFFLLANPNEKIDGLIEQTQNQANNYQNDIRYVSGVYFLFRFSPDEFSEFFGNGEAAINKGKFGRDVETLKERRGFYQSDVGFIGFYSKFGILSIIAWAILFAMVLSNWKTKRYIYVNYFFIYLLFTGLTSGAEMIPDFIATIAISLYIRDATLMRSSHPSTTLQSSKKLNSPIHQKINFAAKV